MVDGTGGSETLAETDTDGSGGTVGTAGPVVVGPASRGEGAVDETGGDVGAEVGADAERLGVGSVFVGVAGSLGVVDDGEPLGVVGVRSSGAQGTHEAPVAEATPRVARTTATTAATATAAARHHGAAIDGPAEDVAASAASRCVSSGSDRRRDVSARRSRRNCCRDRGLAMS